MAEILGTYHKHPLRAFLDDRRGSSSRDAAVTGMGKELQGKWMISDDDYPKFLDLLHNYLFVLNARSLNLVEQPRINEAKPLLLDLDFRYSSDQAPVRTFTQDQIKNFCHEVIAGLNHFFDLDIYEDLRFFVTLRPAPYQDTAKKDAPRKDGIHIECPDLSLSNEKQKVLRTWLLARNSVSQCFSGTGYTNSDEDVYDESMTRKQGWFFFGESKPNIPRYELQLVYTYTPETKKFAAEDVKKYQPRQLMEILSVRYNLVEDQNTVREEMAAEFQSILNPPLPTYQRALPDAQAVPAEENIQLQALMAVQREMMPIVERSDEEKDIMTLLVRNCLSEKRAHTYDTWIRVGWCLHNIEPSEDFFKLWMEFSAKSPKFNQNDVTALRRDWFGRMRKDGDGPRLTEMALRKWARDDNPAAYKQIVDSNILEYCRNCVDGTHFHIARLMKKLYTANYVASINSSSTEWYFYDDLLNMWKHLNQGIQLRRNISFEVAKYMSDAREKIRNDMNMPGISEEMREMYNVKMIKLTKVEASLYNTGFCDSVMKMAANFFYEEDFQQKLNSNIFLFGCRNGVLELRAKTSENPKEHVIFRDGRPEDFVSFLAGQNHPDAESIEYTPFNELNSEQLEHLAGLKDFFEKIIPRPELRAYVLRLLASTLEGTNREQCYYTFIGGGGNGKSKLMDLCRLTFGDYWSSLQTTAITRKRPDAGNANPEIMAIKNKRFIAMQEPDANEPINTSRMKQFSGEDIIEARPLFGDQEKFKVTGKLFMMCNKLPPVHSMDAGTWRRIRVVPFESKFCPPDDPDLLGGKKNHFPRDSELDNKIRLWREVFLSWMVHIYNTEYIPTGLEPVPDIVKKESSDYKESFDSFAKFKADRIRKVVGEKTTIKQIITAYNAWLADGNKRGSRLNPKELQTRLNDEFGDPDDGKTYKHIVAFSDEYGVEEFDQNAAAAAHA
jgi:P4 family phage/plasmid primase-like protien